MPHKKRVQIGLASFEKVPLHEREKSRQQQENHDEHISDRRGKVAAEFAFDDGFDVGKRVHLCSNRTCCRQEKRLLYFNVSAVELIRQVKALPAREREKFLLAVLTLKDEPNKPKKKSRRIKWPDVEARAKRIFGKQVLPNLVLLEREEQAS
jgi:hypothetical protein